MKIDKVNRRIFLQGVGGLLVAIPVLPSLLGKAHAQVAPRNKRFFTLLAPSQIHHTTAFGVTEAMLAGITYNGYRSLALTNSNFNTICPMMGDPFKPYLSKISLVRGLFQGNLGHTAAGLLGCPSSSAGFDDEFQLDKTIDLVMAEKAGLTANDILRLGAETNYYSMTHDGVKPATGVSRTLKFTNNGNPFLIYQNYFTNIQATPVGNVVAKKSLVDRIQGDLTTSLLNRGFISTADKKYLQDHMDYLNDLEKTYGGTAPVLACTPGANNFFNTRPAGASNNINMVNPDLTKPADYIKFLQDSARLIVEAVKCNVFRLGNMRFYASFAPEFIGGEVWHLEHSHKNNMATIFNMNQWLMENLYLEIIKGLDVDEGGGSTFLDNSIIAYTPEFSENHFGHDVPLWLAGKGGGTLEAGRFWDFANPSYTYNLSHYQGANGTKMYRSGAPYNRYWNGILQSWGLVPSDYERVTGTDGNGNPIYRPGYGERDHLYTSKVTWHPPIFQNWIEANKATYFADIGKPLPGLFKIPA